MSEKKADAPAECETNGKRLNHDGYVVMKENEIKNSDEAPVEKNSNSPTIRYDDKASQTESIIIDEPYAEESATSPKAEKSLEELLDEEALLLFTKKRKLEEEAEDIVFIVTLPRSRHGEKESKEVIEKDLEGFKRFKPTYSFEEF